MLDPLAHRIHTDKSRMVYHAAMIVRSRDVWNGDEFSHEEGRVGQVRIEKKMNGIEIYVLDDLVFRGNDECYEHLSRESESWTIELFSEIHELAKTALNIDMRQLNQ